jgi:hypothetical protein
LKEEEEDEEKRRKRNGYGIPLTMKQLGRKKEKR